jgi:two-component system phosphate regulon sensor histidine kinase PhoR
MKEYAKIIGNNFDQKRVDAKILDSVITKELKIRGISAKFGYGIIDKNNNLTKVFNKDYKEKKDNNTYSYPLFTDKKKEHFTVSLWFSKERLFFSHEQLADAFGNFSFAAYHFGNLYYFH